MKVQTLFLLILCFSTIVSAQDFDFDKITDSDLITVSDYRQSLNSTNIISSIDIDLMYIGNSVNLTLLNTELKKNQEVYHPRNNKELTNYSINYTNTILNNSVLNDFTQLIKDNRENGDISLVSALIIENFLKDYTQNPYTIFIINTQSQGLSFNYSYYYPQENSSSSILTKNSVGGGYQSLLFVDISAIDQTSNPIKPIWDYISNVTLTDDIANYINSAVENVFLVSPLQEPAYVSETFIEIRVIGQTIPDELTTKYYSDIILKGMKSLNDNSTYNININWLPLVDDEPSQFNTITANSKNDDGTYKASNYQEFIATLVNKTFTYTNSADNLTIPIIVLADLQLDEILVRPNTEIGSDFILMGYTKNTDNAHKDKNPKLIIEQYGKYLGLESPSLGNSEPIWDNIYSPLSKLQSVLYGNLSQNILKRIYRDYVLNTAQSRINATIDKLEKLHLYMPIPAMENIGNITDQLNNNSWTEIISIGQRLSYIELNDFTWNDRLYVLQTYGLDRNRKNNLTVYLDFEVRDDYSQFILYDTEMPLPNMGWDKVRVYAYFDDVKIYDETMYSWELPTLLNLEAETSRTFSTESISTSSTEKGPISIFAFIGIFLLLPIKIILTKIDNKKYVKN